MWNQIECLDSKIVSHYALKLYCNGDIVTYGDTDFFIVCTSLSPSGMYRILVFVIRE